MAGFAARPQRIPAAANESPQPGGALPLLLPRHSLFRQRQAFQPASFISICELAPRPKQRNALTTKISGKKPLIYLNLAIFQANLRLSPAPPPDRWRKMAQTKASRMREKQARQQENAKDACKKAEEQLDGAAPPGWNNPDWCGWGDSNSQAEALASKTSVSTNSTTSAYLLQLPGPGTPDSNNSGAFWLPRSGMADITCHRS